jgi:hypothetical protein
LSAIITTPSATAIDVVSRSCRPRSLGAWQIAASGVPGPRRRWRAFVRYGRRLCNGCGRGGGLVSCARGGLDGPGWLTRLGWAVGTLGRPIRMLIR